jgi:hypothetical protein
MSSVSGRIYFYKGVNKVKVVTESEGFWTIEALEDFTDFIDGEGVTVKAGERRIVEANTLTEKMVLLPPIKEHIYERKMEKKLQQMIAEEDSKTQSEKKQ